jgi:hypothetical protein
MIRRNTSKVEVMAAILACAEKLGRVPSIPELVKLERLDRVEVRKHFGKLHGSAGGVQPGDSGAGQEAGDGPFI